MEVICFIVMLVYIILYYDLKSNYNKLEKKYKSAVEKIKNMENYAGNMADNIPKVEKVEYANNMPKVNVVHEVKTETPKAVKEKKSINKLNWLFGIGMTLICLTYFVLINSTWDIISNYMKAFLVIMFSGIFFAASVVLEKVLKTKIANMVFWVLGVIYLPFSLITMFGFGLFGEYLSFAGAGSALCIVLVALVSLILNVLSAAKYKNPIFVWLYLVSELFVIIFGTRVFTQDINILLLVMTIYSGIVVYLMEKIHKIENYDFVSKNYEIYKNIMLWSLNALVIFRALFGGSILVINLVTTILMTIIDAYIMWNNSDENSIAIGVASYIGGLVTILEGYACIYANSYTFEMLHLITVSFVFISFIAAIFDEKILNVNAHKSLSIFGYVILGITTIVSVIGTIPFDSYIWLATLFVTVINLVLACVKYKNKVIGYIVPLMLALAVFEIRTASGFALTAETMKHIILAVLGCGYIFVCMKSNKKYVEPFKYGTLIMVPVIGYCQYLSMVDGYRLFEFNPAAIHIFVIFALVALSCIKIKNEKYVKIAKYFVCGLAYNAILTILSQVLKDTNVALISAAIMIFIDIATRYKTGKNCLPISIFANIANGVALLFAIDSGEIILLWYYFISLGYCIYNSIIYANNKGWRNVFTVLYILVANLTLESMFELLYKVGLPHLFDYNILILTLILMAIFATYKKKDVVYMVMLLILNINVFGELTRLTIGTDISLFIKILPYVTYLALMWIQSYFVSEKAKDVYRAIVTVGLLIPYGIIFDHIDKNFAGLNVLVYIADLLIVTRCIWKKYWKKPSDLNILEMIMLFVIYLIVMNQSFVSFNQCIILDFVIMAIIIYSFVKQENNVFIATAISFIVIVLSQTSAVEFPIAWLVILLLSGMGFIGFAAYNEIKKRKQNETNILDK